MPSTSEKMRGFMGADLARKRAGKKTKTGMSEQQLRDFAGSVQQHGSLEDITALENSAGKGSLKLSGYLYEPGGECHDAQKNHEMLASWAAREIKDLPDYKVDVVYSGPDTDYRAEEIDPHQYGRSYEPYPLRDYFKTGDKMRDRTLRLREEDEYDEAATPGTIPDSPLPSSRAYGVAGFREDETELDDNRSFDNQREYARGVKDGPVIDADVKGIDRKKGSKIR